MENKGYNMKTAELEELRRNVLQSVMALYCIVLYLLPVLNPKSYDGARVLEASGRPNQMRKRAQGRA